ncbi:hypothetical protein PAXRUDRAFT_826069 [Paxillus rubicundulus Ve08.2h10]|uniref:Transmembrane protein n=1 Tax=Paxillus rubicundulus Ve08.2h10 TaxID=930991 RepID=A0A0D0DZY1_9AGAM|nr:hypothetical protein PAXRUDRAFT_826069 [Paxillus rubicundulus Ve08.2h10]
MGGGSPTVFLLWSVLSTLFYCFLIFHLWNYDRFKCLSWNQSGRQPGAFKRFMSYTYIATLTCLVIFSVTIATLKFKEGYILTPTGQLTPMPLQSFSPGHRKWLLTVLLALSIGWACELVTHLEELTFWLFLLNQGPTTRLWFDSDEFKLWIWGTLFAILGMPLTTFVSRRDLDLCLAWTLLVGSSASTATTLSFLYVLSRFPAFIRRVKEDGATPNIVLRLVLFFHLNCGRIIFRLLFSIPLFALALDGVQGPHTINSSQFWPDFLLMLGGIGAFVSSAITLLVFFPRSLTQELGYTVAVANPATAPKTPPTDSIDLSRPPASFHPSKDPILDIVRTPSPQPSADSRHDPSPEYEGGNLPNTAHPDSLDGHLRVRAREPHGVETPRSADVPYTESYVFDRRSRSLVRSRSEGHGTGLHPYVREFQSPIDVYDVDDVHILPDR